jgi:hypothetical protein
VHESPQRYEPIEGCSPRFSSGPFVAKIEFDVDGLVGRHEGMAERLA